MTPKPAFPALGAPMSPAWVHGSPHVKDLALLKSLRSCNLTLAKAAGGCREHLILSSPANAVRFKMLIIGDMIPGSLAWRCSR